MRKILPDRIDVMYERLWRSFESHSIGSRDKKKKENRIYAINDGLVDISFPFGGGE